MQTTALKNCNVLPFTKTEPSSTKALKATIVVLAISAFVVGFLALLASQNVFSCALAKIGTIVPSCMMGAGALLFIALYYVREGTKVALVRVASKAQVKPAEQVTPKTVKPEMTSIEKVQRLSDAEFLALSLKEFSDDTSKDHHPLIEALCHRFHTLNPPKKAPINPSRLTLGDIPSLNGAQISKGLYEGTLPKQLLICLSPDQVKAFDQHLMNMSTKRHFHLFEGQKLIANHLFQIEMGPHSDKHLRSIYQKMEGSMDHTLITSKKIEYFSRPS